MNGWILVYTRFCVLAIDKWFSQLTPGEGAKCPSKQVRPTTAINITIYHLTYIHMHAHINGIINQYTDNDGSC